MNSHKNYYSCFLGLWLFVLVTACNNLQSIYSERAYQQAVTLKVESLDLISHATNSFTSLQADVEHLKTDLQKAYEYARGRPNNETSTRQWKILIDPERNLLGGFLARWEEEEKLSPVFVAESSKIISDAFDTIIELESGKLKPEDLE